MQFAVLSASIRVRDIDVAFMVEACNQQAQECADAWGVARMPVAFYASVQDLPVRDVITAVIVDDLEDPGALGYHSAIAGTPFIKVLAQDGNATGITLSHEVLETLVDPSASGWWPRVDGTAAAAEVCDPVEGDSYTVGVTLAGEFRKVFVSDYVLPAWTRWTDVSAGPGPFDKMGRLSKQWTMTPGGYMVIQDAHGNESDVFASRRVAHGGPQGEANAGRKLSRPTGRLLRRLRAP